MGYPTIRALLDVQQKAFRAEGAVTAEVRKARLQAAIDLLVEHNDALCAAMDEDFGGRPPVFSMMNDILGSLASLKHARDHLEAWMAPDPRPSVAPFDAFGATAWVQYQPKGVVGIIGTWNAPLYTLFSPLASVLAAGNRAVLKPSEIAPRTAALLASVLPAYFDAEVVGLINGDAEVARAFSAEPWNHLVFTGSTAVGKAVMAAAAANLVPVTLELGGKSPVLVDPGADIGNAAERIVVGKAGNAGQLCVAPDTVWLPRARLEDFIAAARACHEGLFPTAADVVAVVNERHAARLQGYIDEARARGVRVETAGVGEGRRMALHLVIDPPAGSAFATEEIFGPALVLNTYERFEEALDAVNAGPRPLALYWFGSDGEAQQQVLARTLSGGVSLNDVTMHPALHDAPFGGVGASGMGHYHGREGFLEFSHARSVYQAGGHDPRREWGMLPPYNDAFRQAIRAAVTR